MISCSMAFGMITMFEPLNVGVDVLEVQKKRASIVEALSDHEACKKLTFGTMGAVSNMITWLVRDWTTLFSKLTLTV